MLEAGPDQAGFPMKGCRAGCSIRPTP